MEVIMLALVTTLTAVVLDWRFNSESIMHGKVSMASFFMMFHIVFYVIGGVYLYLTASPNITFLASLLLGLLIPGILYQTMRVFFRWKVFQPAKDSNKGERLSRLSQISIAGMFSLSVLGVAWYLRYAGVPVLSLILGENVDYVRQLRTESVFDFQFAYLFRGLFSVIHVISIMSFLGAVSSKTLRSYIWAAVMVIGTSFLYLANVEKAPVVFYWASLAFSFALKRGSFQMSRLTKTLLLLSVLGYVVISTMATYGFDNINEAASLAASRIFLYQVIGPFTTYEYVPRFMDFLHGASYHLPSFIIPNKISLESYLFYIIFRGIGSGSAPPGILANAYANFGFLPSLIEYIFVFVALFSVEHWFSRSNDRGALACRAWLIMYSNQVIIAGSSTAVLISPALFFVIVLFVLTRRNYVDKARLIE